MPFFDKKISKIYQPDHNYDRERSSSSVSGLQFRKRKSLVWPPSKFKVRPVARCFFYGVMWSNEQTDQMRLKGQVSAGSQFCDAGIPGGNFPSNYACWAARRMNQAKNRTAGHTLFMRIASPAHVIRPLLLWVVLSRSLHVKALEFTAFVVRVGTCTREYDLI